MVTLADRSYLAHLRNTPGPFVQFVSGHYPPATVGQAHSHRFVAFHGCLQGPLVLSTPKGRITLDAGGSYLLAPGIEHFWCNGGKHTATAIGLLIDTEHPGNWPDRSGIAECCHKLAALTTDVHRLDTARDEHFKHLFWMASDYLVSEEPFDVAGTVGTLISLMSRCVKQLEGTTSVPAVTTDLGHCIRRLLLLRVNDRISISEIARELAVSPTRAKEAFRKTFGSGIIAYHNQLKMWQAKRWLSDLSLTIKEVQNKLGFSSSSYFSQAFRQYTGESPTEFRHRVSADK